LRVTDAPSRTRAQKGEVVIDVKKGDEILEMTVPLDAISLVGK